MLDFDFRELKVREVLLNPDEIVYAEQEKEGENRYFAYTVRLPKPIIDQMDNAINRYCEKIDIMKYLPDDVPPNLQKRIIPKTLLWLNLMPRITEILNEYVDGVVEEVVKTEVVQKDIQEGGIREISVKRLGKNTPK